MSKFFEELEKESVEKKVRRVAHKAAESEEESDERAAVSNKERRYDELRAICRESDALKKPKEVEQFFKRISRFGGLFQKEGVPGFLHDFFAETEKKKGTLPMFKQRRAKFVEKYETSEVVLEEEGPGREKNDLMEQINKCLLTEPPAKRREALCRLESEVAGGGAKIVERHRLNVYIMSVMAESELSGGDFGEMVDRLRREREWLGAMPEDEKEIFGSRLERYVRRMVKHIQFLERSGEQWEDELAGLAVVAEELAPFSKIPLVGEMEVVFFLKNEVRRSEFPLFNAIIDVRNGSYEKALDVYRSIWEEGEGAGDAEGAKRAGYLKFVEELGQLAFLRRDFDTAMGLLDEAHSHGSKNVWQSQTTEIMLHALCLCFEEQMAPKGFFGHFVRTLWSVEKNPLLLKGDSFRDEAARAFVLLRYGDYREASRIVGDLLPGFECRGLLEARARDICLGSKQ